MAVINGTDLLLYADGTLIAAQKNCTISVEQDLFDATNKESGGWARHGSGLLSAKIDFDSLVSTTGKSYTELMAYVTGRKSLLITVLGLGYPIVAEVDISSISLSASQESAMGLSGSFKVNGALFVLNGTSANVMTDPDGTSSNYDTFTISGTAITSGINIADSAIAQSNTFNIANGDVWKVATFLTLNSGQAPYVSLLEVGVGAKSNIVQLSEGLNIATLTATADVTGAVLAIENTAASNFALSTVYVWKHA